MLGTKTLRPAAIATVAWCERVERLPPHAFEMTKPLLRAAVDAPWEQSLTLEEYAEANCFSTATLASAAIKRGAK
jgi:2-(1,2-epoxy-1,2-dihydrophenyl)acetyl-CoA isomerase